MVTRVRTVDFLPEIFRTDTNRQFLAASLDVLTQQPNLTRVEGFIGNKYGNGVNPLDKYVVEPTKTRTDYQLDPSVVFLKPDTQTAQDFISYPGIVQSLKNAGAIVNDQNRLFENEFYSWDPFVDYDKIVNYAQYYWIPLGPDAVPVVVSGDITAEIVGQQQYTSSNGIKFTNGLKVEFQTSVVPTSYAGNQYYVEGVGTSIVLLPVANFVVPEASGSAVYGLWDAEPWDIINWDATLWASITPDYLTISRNSSDYNAWTRSNRWFHQDVLNITTAALGSVTSENSNPVTRALRPILEFRGNLQLWNSGNNSAGSVTVIDTVTTNAFVAVEGQSSYTVDGYQLQNGDTVVFSADADQNVRKTVYTVNIVPAGSGGDDVITLIDSGAVVIDQSQFCVLNGAQWIGTTWRWLSETQNWSQCQIKTLINQAPLFDIYDMEGISIGNNIFYSGTTFVGTKLFSYTPGSGPNDPVLGFPITYSSVTNIGDISFTVNMNADTYSYKNISNVIVERPINIGYVHYNTSPTTYELLTGWVNAAAPSIQYQTFQFTITTPTNTLVCDVPAVADVDTPWTPVQVFVNDTALNSNEFTVSVDTVIGTTTITLAAQVLIDTKVTVLVYSNSVSATAFYEIPSNLQSNPFNANITNVDVGDIRNQYQTIYSNAPGVTGPLFGDNNIHNLGNLNSYGTSIIQNSASLVLPGLFLRKPQVSFFDALQYNRDQYSIYKSLIVDLAFKNDYSVEQSPAEILDSIIYEITTTRSNSTIFFWTDTLFSGSPYITNSYSFGAAPATAIFTLNRVYTTDSANYYAVALYLSREIDGITRTKQLIRGIDYVVSPIAASVTVTYPIVAGDTLTIKEYNQTYGSYCPSTPSSLGMYPAFVPTVVYDTSYTPATYFIRGHDGSYTKLYGPYVNGQLVDFRDIALLEFETRIYNNIKTSGDIPLIWADVAPGQFRTTDYSNDEILDIYSTEFLNWVGTNRIDYKTQAYNLANPFSYNYNQSSDKLSNTALQQGYWRGIYRWLYDTDSPDTTPWEMLGLSVKPSWWDSRYGAAPYSSGNTYMWNEIAQGIIWNDGDSYVDPQRVRPELLDVLPVNSAGELLNPFEVIVGNYNRLTFNRDWRVGDVAPAESSYIKSSTWPFDLMRVLALTKPAQFFNLFADLDLYKFNTTLNQYLYDNRYHLDSRTLEVYGNGVAKNSYINWVVDYVNVKNLNGYDTVTTLLQNMDVRLTYNMAGFSAKDYLKFYIERATPNSKNTSFLIPDESYAVLLYDNPPEEQIYYSSVIVQRTANGWRVWGNSVNRQYFTLAEPKQNGLYRSITVNNTTVKVWNDWYTDRDYVLPYGTLLYGRDTVANFLNNYGHYLIQQGVVFDNISAGTVYDWDRMIQEFLAWSEQEWEVGSIIALNPNAQYFTVYRPGLVVQPLTIQDQNFILNQNLIPIQSQNSAVIRENEKFSIKIINDGDTVSYTNLNLNSIEHAVVFDNSSVFNDVIYNLTTGLRQPRLLLKGYKTAEWTGFVDTAGFILNENNIQEWQSSQKYAKGSIVLYKSLYWVASTLIEPSVEFDTKLWFRVNYDQIKRGLLPNPSTNAYESLYYYDTNKANLELDADQLAFSLIGYRPREYMTAADLSDITQINVYKNFIKGKGTNQIAEGFKNANFDQGAIDYDIYENWAINSGSFGKVLNSNYVEAELDQHLLTGNPTLLGFSSSGQIDTVNQTVLLSQLINWERQPTSQSFLPEYQLPYVTEIGLPTAGYVDKRDVKFYVFEYNNLNDDNTIINTLYAGDTIWIAKYDNSWAVLSAVSLGIQVVSIFNNQNNTATINFSGAHNLVVNDPFAISSFDPLFNKFYRVKSVSGLTSVIVDAVINPSTTIQQGAGIAFGFISSRYDQASDMASYNYPITNRYRQRSWVDNDQQSNWAVWRTSPVYGEVALSVPSSPDLGTAVAYDARLGKLVGDSSTNTVYIEKQGTVVSIIGASGFGSKILINDDALYVAGDSTVCYYWIDNLGSLLLTQQISVVGTISSIAVSNDSRWLYVAKELSSEIELYHLDSTTGQYAGPSVLTAPSGALGWGHSIATSIDGVKLIVGAPDETVSGLSNAGAVYTYTRGYQRFVGDGVTVDFIVNGVLSAELVDVTVNSVLVSDYSLTDFETVTFDNPPPNGAIILVSYDSLTQQQRLQALTPQIGALYGSSVDTNRYGANIVIGSPYDINTVNQIAGVEGAVYQYANSGQRYGEIICSNPSVTIGDRVFINGYLIEFGEDSSNTVFIAETINSSTSSNIVATASGNTLYISVVDDTIEVRGNIIDLVSTPQTLTSLNYTPYSKTQTIYNNIYSKVSEFGGVVKMNERDALVISATTGARISQTTFDYSDDCVQNDTVYDNNTTTFVDTFPNTGLVYEYNYLPAYNESISNPGQYAFGQYISTSNTSYGSEPRFGTALAYKDNVIMVGAPDWTQNQSGFATSFEVTAQSTTCDITGTTSWYLEKQAAVAIDISKINNISIYNRLTNQTIDFLDYTDPIQGKLLGALATNIDYIGISDPAGYETDNQQWGPVQVGRMWLDTSNLRILNYQQPDVVYNATNWGKAFPGSSAPILTWVESTVSPLEYSGSGFPIVFDKFVSRLKFDESTNSVITVYYFWVQNLDAVPPGKTLSPLTISLYVLNPINSGISFIAPLTVTHNESTADVIAIFNSSQSINDYSSVLHIGYGNNIYEDTKHTVWQLIAKDNPDSFLGGLPIIPAQSPSGLYLKYLDSFSGVNTDYQDVPDPRLPELIKYGVSVVPRQTMFLNRRTALKNYVQYANSVLASEPIVETRNLAFLQTSNDIENQVIVPSCKTATASNLNATYSNGVDGVGATLNGSGSLPEISGVLLSIGDRVLVKDQDDPIQNGVYVVSQTGPNWILTRSTDFDTDISYGRSTVIVAGDYNGTIWTLVTNGTIIIGTSELNFDQLITGPTYNTTQFWTYANWWATGYDNSTKPVIEVNSYLDLQSISDSNVIITGTNGLVLSLTDGLIAKVSMNNTGLSEIYSYSTTSGWIRVGVLNGTIQISDSLWQNTYAWDTLVWDSDSWNRTQYTEIRYIVRWLNEVVYTGNLLANRNASLALMFTYIQSENIERNNYNPWLTKTSLIDVKHRIRGLLQYKKFQRDNQEFLRGYLNEVKPYHVYIKDFIYSYDGIDSYLGDVTDFDLPAKYNSSTGKFDSPQLIYQPPIESNQYLPDDPIWANPNYNQWFANYGLQYGTNTQGRLTVTRLAESIDNTQTTAIVQSFYGLEKTDIIYIGAEQIKYTELDRDTGTISGMTRGFNGTVPTSHGANSPVSVNSQAVIVLDPGRGYTTDPTITVSIDTSYYPQPRANAEFTTSITGGQLTSVTVSDSGSGYAINPTVIVSGGSISAQFSNSSIDSTNNVITVSDHTFITGDSVVYDTSNTEVDYGLTDGDYYYVRVIDANTIALYETYYGSKIQWLGVTTLVGDINSVTTTITIADANILPNSFNTVEINEEKITYTGIDYTTSTLLGVIRSVDGTIASSHSANSQIKVDSVKYADLDTQRISLSNATGTATGTLTSTARVQTFTESYPIRMMNVSLNFNRTTYVSDEVYGWDVLPSDDGLWDDSNGDNAANRIEMFYEPTVNMPGKDLPQLMSGLRYPNSIIDGISFSSGAGWGSPGDETLRLTGPEFSDTVPKIYTMSGGEFQDGYAPEELVAGVVSDLLNITVISDDATLSFRQIIDRSGNKVVLNSNPYTQVFLTQSLSATDTEIYVSDVTPLIDTRFNAVGNIIYINGEFIRFSGIDSTTNALTDIQRGIMGTAVNEYIEGGTINATALTPGIMYSIVTVGSTDFTVAGAGSNTVGIVFYANSNSVNLTGNGTVIPVIQSVLERNKLYYLYENLWWYGPPTDPSANTTLATNTSFPAEFLQKTS